MTVALSARCLSKRYGKTTALEAVACCWPDRVRVWLEPLEERRFDNGMVFLRYRTRV